MELFAAAGIDLPSTGRAKGAVRRSLRTPLFAPKALDESLARSAFAPTAEQEKVASDYARKLKRLKAKETTVRPVFVDEILVKLLGYTRLDPEARYTLAYEQRLGSGAVDTALGHFEPDGTRRIAAPFELKGPDTLDLDRIMPGRGKTPVQQAWEYANDAPGAKWVLVSNCREIRLYGYGRGREAYHLFDLTRLDEPDEHRRLWHLLAAERFLGGATDALLRETDVAYRDITDDLYASYNELRKTLLDFLVHSDDGPRLASLAAAIEPAQKILDRILFIAFAQRNDLMRDGLLERAAKTRNDFEPQPIWRNFLGLFRWVDQGHFDQDVPPYNGGLFARDPLVDSLVLPDHLATELAELGNWDYKREAPVSVLGHIFEKSITDIERLRAEARGQEAPKVAKTKKEGVVYTKSEAVIRFIIEATLGRTLAETRDALRAAHAPPERDMNPEEEARFLRAWLDALMGTTVVDPACGSGAFLVAALDRLALEYRPVVARLAELGDDPKVDVFDTILTRNLYGVDLNAESVEITRLSLWLKTARRERPLQSLDANVVAGDSIISDARYTARPFDWRAAFPQVFAAGGFDAVIGNPPYVRMEFIKPFKPWLAENYVVAADRTDLYAYFFERGASLLKPGGRLGYISSSTYFRTGSAEKLRTFLTDGLAIETVIDFGDLQIFEGVTTYPAILTLRKGGDGHAGDLSFLKLDEAVPEDLAGAFARDATTMPRERLGGGSWQFEEAPLAKLRDKIVKGRKTLGEVYGAPLYGIKTGLNEAFVIDRATRDGLVARDAKSEELLKPFLRGEDIKRWRVEPEGLFLINIPKGVIDIDAFPAIRDHLALFRKELEGRATEQEWFELQQAQAAYHQSFAGAKIVYQDITNDNPFCRDDTGAYLANTCYFVPTSDFATLSYLNSNVAWFFFGGTTNIARGGYLRLRTEFVQKLPIPALPKRLRTRLAALGEACTKNARERFSIVAKVRARILTDLAPPGGAAKLSRKLEQWHDLDFRAFEAELKRALKAKLTRKQSDDWQAYLDENAAVVKALTRDIETAEREIDALVYEAFDLTPDEIALLEASLAGQT